MGRRFHFAALTAVVVLAGLGTGDAAASRPALGAPAALLRAHAAVFAGRFSAADGPDLQLSAPANGATIADGTSVSLSWSFPWSCASCETEEDILVSTDASFTSQTYMIRSFCEASAAPDCATTVPIGPLAPGTYYWAVAGLGDPAQPTHFSAISSFTVSATANPAAPVTPPVPRGGTAYTDSTTDGGGAPNITAVTVSNDATSGEITLRMFVQDFHHPPAAERYFVYFDTDDNEYTGDPDAFGAEFRITLDATANTFTPGRWDGSTYVYDASKSITVSYEASDIVFTLEDTDLGNGSSVSEFAFWVGAYRTAGSFYFYDFGPDNETWDYQLLTAPTPPLPTTVRSMKVATLPAAPSAGLPFRVLVTRVTLSTGISHVPDHVSCAARLGTAVLRGRGAGGCTFTIPAKAAGKVLIVRVTAGYLDAKRVQAYRFTIRRG